jgi:hypothetical protein
MFAGGDYARTGCSVSEVTDLYISVQKQTPMRLVVPIANLSQVHKRNGCSTLLSLL